MFESPRRAWPALLLAVLLVLPFLGKAFTIDDTLFLKQAEQMSRDPLHSTRFTIVWNKDVPEPFARVQASGPVMALLLVPAILHGADERLAHLPGLLCLLVAVLATVSLARRLGLSPRASTLAGLLVVASPAVLAMAPTAMPDVPAMAFGVLALERLWAFREDGRWHQALLAVVALALAGLSRSHLWLLLGVGALVMVEGDPLRPASYAATSLRRWLPLAAGLGLGLAVIVLLSDRDPAGTFVHATGSLLALHPIGRNLLCFSTHWAIALPLTLPWVLLRWRVLPWRVAWVSMPLALAQILYSEHGGALWVAPVATLTVVVLVDIVRDALVRGDRVQLALAAWLFIAAPIACYVHLPAKYVAASAPAAALLVARLIDAAPRRRALGVSLSTLGAGVILGVLIASADARFAAVGREMAATLIAPEAAQGKRVWFAGHWGFQWYAERAGGRSLVRSERPAPGERLVVARMSLLPEDEPLPPAELVRTVSPSQPGGRIMNKSAGAGFYSNGWGYLPWTFSDAPLDRFEVYRVE